MTRLSLATKAILVFIILGMIGCQSSQETSSVLEIEQSKSPAFDEEMRAMKFENGEALGINPLLHWYQKESTSRNSGNFLTNVQEMYTDQTAGRIRAFMIDSRDTNHLILGGISGGIWHSRDQGQSWEPLDDNASNLSVTSIDQDPFHPDIMYYTSGEVRGNSAGISGIGVFKSTDGGESFDLLAGTQSNDYFKTWKVLCSREQKDKVYVASKTGLHSSTNQGEDWRQVFFSEVTDVEEFGDGGLIIGARAKGIFMSPNGKPNSFVKIEHDSLPPADSVRRIELAYCQSDENRIYAAYESKRTRKLYGLYRSDDKGDTWKKVDVESVSNIFNYVWYTIALNVDPNDPDKVMIGSVRAAYSTDGGENWDRLNGGHADKHTFFRHPDMPNALYLTSDGGIDRYEWRFGRLQHRGNINEGLNITQYYEGSSFHDRELVLGGTQDNGTHVVSADGTFRRIFGGDGSFNDIDLNHPNILYVSYQNGNLFRLEVDTTNANNSSYVKIADSLFMQMKKTTSNFYFINPMELNPFNTDEVYVTGLDALFRSKNRGDNWEKVANLDHAFCLEFLKQDDVTSLVIGGSKSLLKYIPDIDNHTFNSETDLSATRPDSLKNAFMFNIVAHPSEVNAVFVTYSSYAKEDRIYKISDIHTTEPVWESVSGGLPDYLPVNDVAAIAQDDGNVLLIAGTDYGLYYSLDEGENWQKESQIPNVVIRDLSVVPSTNRIDIFTHGRSIFTANYGTDPVAGLNDAHEVSDVIVYPNPTSDVLRIQDDINLMDVMIYDFKGQLKYHKRGDFRQIDVQSWSPGTYILKATDRSGKMYRSKFMKQ